MNKSGKRSRKQVLSRKVHFFVPDSVNESLLKRKRRSSARSNPVSAHRLTFEQLIQCMVERVGQPGAPAASALQNLRSALLALLSERGLDPTTPVGSTLRISFHRVIEQHVRVLRSEQRPAAYIANRKSLLKQWRELVLRLDREDASGRGEASPLQAALQQIFAEGASIKGTARVLGIPLASLRRWLRGATPQRGSERYFRRLERFFGMPSGALTDLLPKLGRELVSQAATQTIAYRMRLRMAITKPYAMSADSASAEFQDEWTSLVRFKTDLHGGVLEPTSPRGSRTALWRLTPMMSESRRADAWIDTLGVQLCRTARINFAFAAQFFGWLMMDIKEGGLALPKAQAQTLGQFTNRENLKSYLNWRIKRSGGVISGACSQVLIFVAMLCHPEHGFLVTRTDIGRRLGLESEEWRERCRETKEYANRVRQNMQPRQRKSRDPFEPIKETLALDNPLDAIADALRRLEADRPMTSGLKEAIWARDRLLLALSASNPLRALNLKELTYREDGSGQLRKDKGGRWRIVIPKESFKNEAGAAKDRNYDQVVQEQVCPIVETYLRDYRPMLASADNDRVFVSSGKRSDSGVWVGLNRHYEALTRRYLHGCPGTGPHCIRHIVATALVKRTGSFVAAALVLHDKEETVRQNYGHLCGDDGARWLAGVLGEALNKRRQ